MKVVNLSLKLITSGERKHGIRKTYREDEIIVERFVEDQKEGLLKLFR
jgi:hypothetical protein